VPLLGVNVIEVIAAVSDHKLANKPARAAVALFSVTLSPEKDLLLELA
jgi:hypothetical protein